MIHPETCYQSHICTSRCMWWDSTDGIAADIRTGDPSLNPAAREFFRTMLQHVTSNRLYIKLLPNGRTPESQCSWRDNTDDNRPYDDSLVKNIVLGQTKSCCSGLRVNPYWEQRRQCPMCFMSWRNRLWMLPTKQAVSWNWPVIFVDKFLGPI